MEHDGDGARLAPESQRLFAVTRADGEIARRSERGGDEVVGVCIVFDDQHAVASTRRNQSDLVRTVYHGRTRAHRQRERERAPLFERAVNADADALQVDKAIDERKPEPRAADLPA